MTSPNHTAKSYFAVHLYNFTEYYCHYDFSQYSLKSSKLTNVYNWKKKVLISQKITISRQPDGESIIANNVVIRDKGGKICLEID